MPLKEGTSQKTVSENIKEVHGGPQYKKTEEKHGKAVADKQAIAIAENQKRESMSNGPQLPRSLAGGKVKLRRI